MVRSKMSKSLATALLHTSTFSRREMVILRPNEVAQGSCELFILKYLKAVTKHMIYQKHQYTFLEIWLVKTSVLRHFSWN